MCFPTRRRCETQSVMLVARAELRGALEQPEEERGRGAAQHAHKRAKEEPLAECDELVASRHTGTALAPVLSARWANS